MSLSETEEEWLQGLLDEAEVGDRAPRLKDWDRRFLTDQRRSLADYGSAMHVSGRMWTQLRRIADSLGYGVRGAGDDE